MQSWQFTISYYAYRKGILPDIEGANLASKYCHLGVASVPARDILEWLAEKGYYQFDGANDTCSKGHLDILKWLKKKGYYLILGANWAS